MELTEKELEVHRVAASASLQVTRNFLELPGSKMLIQVKRPTPLLLALPVYDLIPMSLSLAVCHHLKSKLKAQTNPTKVVRTLPVNREPEGKRIEKLLRDELIGEFYENLKDPLDRWILGQMAVGRLEPILPEELESFAVGGLEDFARAYSAPPSTYLGEMVFGWPLAGTITGYALDAAAAVYRNFYADFEQSMGVAKTTRQMFKNFQM